MNDSQSSRFPAVRAAVALLMPLALLWSATNAHAASWALVNADGTLSKSRGVVANYREATGFYRIVFRKSVAKCVPMVTLRDGGYLAPVAYEVSNPGEVWVITLDDGFANKDASFYIALVC